MRDSSPTPWWRHGAVYQVYIRSFADGNGDGTGDLTGLRSRLPYIASLGVDAIWVNPWFPSPLNDGGYDVADYRDINPRYGSLDEADALIREARGHGLGVMVDLVPNHTSSEHRWFREALASPPGSAARNRYHFRDGRGPTGNEPPTNWKSVFGGSTWTRVPDGQWYLHLFDPTQPDLNWANPEVLDEFDAILRFWLDRGATGFRVDVAHGLEKDPAFPDMPSAAEFAFRGVDGEHPHWDRPGIHDIVRRWRTILDEYPDSVMVAEAWVANWDRLAPFLRPDEYHQVFDFEFLESPWDATELVAAIRHSLDGAATVGAVPTWVLSNHDVVRHATRYGLPPDVVAKEWLLDGDRSLLDARRGLRRARAGALLMLALPGSVYLYQGEELGLPEVHDLDPSVLDDPTWQRSGFTEKGRDGCRVPLPWTMDGPSFGFGDDGTWLPQPEGWGDYAVAAQEGVDGSTLELYRTAMDIRRRVLSVDEDLTWVDLGEGIVAFERGSGVRCVVNLSGAPCPITGSVLVASEPVVDGVLPVDAAAWTR
jgi:alpha-glucosidase